MPFIFRGVWVLVFCNPSAFFLNAPTFCLKRHGVFLKGGRLFSTGHHLFEKDDGLYFGVK